jgi:hypothetical protein
VGPLLANTKLFVAADGTVLMADARPVGPGCGWSFAAQIASLHDVALASSIRRERPGVDQDRTP